MEECEDGREGDGALDGENTDGVDEGCGDGDSEDDVWRGVEEGVGETLRLKEEVPVRILSAVVRCRFLTHLVYFRLTGNVLGHR